MSSLRRRWLQHLLAGATGPLVLSSPAVAATNPPSSNSAERPALSYPPVLPGIALEFPRDHGAHPEYRTEWWYLTGWLENGTQPLGFQLTFFRTRTRHSADNPSRFAPTQLLFAHAALANAQTGRLIHDQRAARVGMEHAQFATRNTDLRLGDWTLQLHDGHRYRAAVHAREFNLDLELSTPDAPWLQGEQGFSRKGPRPEQASYYYSRPQLQVLARVALREARDSRRSAASASAVNASALRGVAWLDHEWSSEILDLNANGWDWAGLNLDNGQSLVAFVIRAAGPAVPSSEPAPQTRPPAIWSYAALRERNGSVTHFGREVMMAPLRTWVSPRTAIRYPVAMSVALAGRSLTLEPLLDDQELDSRASTGAIYWEGAVRVHENGRPIGRGYLELTGYGERLRL